MGLTKRVMTVNGFRLRLSRTCRQLPPQATINPVDRPRLRCPSCSAPIWGRRQRFVRSHRQAGRTVGTHPTDKCLSRASCLHRRSAARDRMTGTCGVEAVDSGRRRLEWPAGSTMGYLAARRSMALYVTLLGVEEC